MMVLAVRRCRFRHTTHNFFLVSVMCVYVCTRKMMNKLKTVLVDLQQISQHCINLCQMQWQQYKHTTRSACVLYFQRANIWINRICINQHIAEIIWPKCCMFSGFLGFHQNYMTRDVDNFSEIHSICTCFQFMHI